MGGSCDMEFEGETAKEIGDKGGAHTMEMATNNEDHRKMAEAMKNSTEEEKQSWWDDFGKKFDEKRRNKQCNLF